MIDLKDIRQVKKIYAQIHSVFDTPDGEEVMDFLEEACGWYESVYDPVDRDRVLINAGRREVVATLKTFLKHSPEDIVLLAKQKEIADV